MRVLRDCGNFQALFSLPHSSSMTPKLSCIDTHREGIKERCLIRPVQTPLAKLLPFVCASNKHILGGGLNVCDKTGALDQAGKKDVPASVMYHVCNE